MLAFPKLASALMVCSITLSVDIVEFVQIVRSTDHELRSRFDLPAECDPVVSAVRKPRNKVKVFITCLTESHSIQPKRPHGQQ